MSDSLPMESAQQTQETPVLFSESFTWSNVPDAMPIDVEHADSEKSQGTSLITPDYLFTPVESQGSVQTASGDHVHIPAAVESVMSNGVAFACTVDSWCIGQDNVGLKKLFSIYFTFDTPCICNNVVMGLIDVGVMYEDILSIQRRLSSNTWVIALRTAKAQNTALSVWHLTIAGHHVFLADCDNQFRLVKIYNAPNEMPVTVLIGRLSAYGTILSFRRDLAADTIFNGIRTARMRIEKPIPSTVRIVREFVWIWYPEQPKACRRCRDLGHLIKDCTSVRCFNCEQSGHRADECEMPMMCLICRSDSHREHRCTYLLFSANVNVENSQESSASPLTLYASAAKVPCVDNPG